MSTKIALPFTLPRSGFCGTEFYRLVASPYNRGEALLEDGCGLRGRNLAFAVGGIEAWKKSSIRLSPARCIKWLALFHAGYFAEKVSDRPYGNWRYRLAAGPLVRQEEAIRTAAIINARP